MPALSLKEGKRLHQLKYESCKTSQEWICSSSPFQLLVCEKRRKNKSNTPNSLQNTGSSHSISTGCCWKWKVPRLQDLPPAPSSFLGCTTETPQVQGGSIRHSALHCPNAFNVINQRLAFFIFPHDRACICRVFKSPQFQYFRMTKVEFAIGNYCTVD